MAGAQSIRAGRAFVELGTDNSKLIQGLKQAQRRLQAFGASVQAVGAGFLKLGATMAAPLILSTRHFMKAGDQLDKMSRRTGVGVEALSELGFAAEQSGTNLESLEMGLRRMQRSISDAGRGMATAKDALGALGLVVADLKRLSPEQQFKLMADRLNGIADPTQRAATAMELFGRSGSMLLPMIEGGAKGIEALQRQARDLGLTISTQTARDAAELTDRFNELWRSTKMGAVAIGGALAGELLKWVASAKKTVKVVVDWIVENRQLVVTMAKVTFGILAAGAALVVLAGAIKVVAIGIKSLTVIIAAYRTVTLAAAAATGVFSAALAFLAANPIVIVLTAIVALIAAIGIIAWRSSRSVSALRDEMDWSNEVAVMERARQLLQEWRARREGEATSEAEEDAAAAEARLKSQEEWARKVHQLKLRQIQDEHERAIALINERYDHEAEKASGAGAGPVVAAHIEQARELELSTLNTQAVDRQYAEEMKLWHELQMRQLDGVEDLHQRELAQIDERHRYEVQAAQDAGDAWRVAYLDAFRESEIELANAREALRLRQNLETITNADLARQQSIEELRLQTILKGYDLEVALLELRRKQAAEAARAASQNLALVEEEFDLRQKLIDASFAPALQIASRGTFSATVAARGGIDAGGSEKDLLEDIKRILDDIRRRGGGKWGL